MIIPSPAIILHVATTHAKYILFTTRGTKESVYLYSFSSLSSNSDVLMRIRTGHGKEFWYIVDRNLTECTGVINYCMAQ